MQGKITLPCKQQELSERKPIQSGIEYMPTATVSGANVPR